MSERRPNPPGWTQPKAPYNPYDPMDQRPAEGYPSEFKTPHKPRNWTMVPKEPSNYREMKESMRKLNYTPRPPSELYPGQYKVLRRKGASGFNNGVRLMGKAATAVVIIGSVFFYRWNDGYDNVFSETYRWQLRMKERLFGHGFLTQQQQEDLAEGSKQRGMVKKTSPLTVQEAEQPREDMALERPGRSHVIEAERIRQEREEAILRAVSIAEEKLASKSPQRNSSWKFWQSKSDKPSDSGEPSTD